MTTILYITDLYYNAKGRNYYEEDLFITSRLKQHFNILIAHPQQVIAFLDRADILVYRNTGSILGYEEYFKDFLHAVKEKNVLTFNSFDGKADQKGKQYLLDLQALKYPVIPTVENMANIEALGNPEKYIVKLKNGADSIGMELLTREELFEVKPEGKLIQPWINFEYEVSFYYLNNEFQYAMYAPNKQKRWELTEYTATPADLEFARKFQIWNNIDRGITRVDACRLQDGSLLLVELEDLNPFLSLELLSERKRNQFINNLVIALTQMIPEKPQVDKVLD
ncbi:hypothetical protein [Gillisia limnaea]|uniref:ATP-grasp domain-containing protein n=1 Tax=Gillisia limnaea (strain DSM 15749 / LMG 21470 / R-8282) TaxID=865937 RepID=H2BWD4_GILLR|nr:hypothetical protein [Gillisia limnaea]EHQ01877.1 hypothetical protein Gilli_1206 [Gillisia limnaea DSM 15749]